MNTLLMKRVFESTVAFLMPVAWFAGWTLLFTTLSRCDRERGVPVPVTAVSVERAP